MVILCFWSNFNIISLNFVSGHFGKIKYVIISREFVIMEIWAFEVIKFWN